MIKMIGQKFLQVKFQLVCEFSRKNRFFENSENKGKNLALKCNIGKDVYCYGDKDSMGFQMLFHLFTINKILLI